MGTRKNRGSSKVPRNAVFIKRSFNDTVRISLIDIKHFFLRIKFYDTWMLIKKILKMI